MIEKEIHSLLEAEAKAVAGIPVTGEFEKAIELLYHHVHEKNGKLIKSFVILLKKRKIFNN